MGKTRHNRYRKMAEIREAKIRGDFTMRINALET